MSGQVRRVGPQCRRRARGGAPEKAEDDHAHSNGDSPRHGRVHYSTIPAGQLVVAC
jgi:hypothetical protein